VETKPWVREGTQLDLPDITENKVTPRIMKGFIVG
jgi:phage tail protein X